MSEATIEGMESEAKVEAPPADETGGAAPIEESHQPAPPLPGPEPRRESNVRRDSKGTQPQESGRKSVVIQAPGEGAQSHPAEPSAPRKSGKRRMSMFDAIEELPGANTGTGSGGKVADTLAKDLAGTLQSFFTQEEKGSDSNALKPLRRPKHIYENTFRLQAYNPFNRDRVQKVLEATLSEMVDPLKYNSEASNDIATKISEKIRSRVLALRFDRYKIIVMTNIGPLNRQGVHIGFRCLWDAEKDSYATSSYKNTTVFCSAVVYGVYYE